MKKRTIILFVLLISVLIACRDSEEATPTATPARTFVPATAQPANDITSNNNPTVFDPTDTSLPAPCRPRAGQVQYVSLLEHICFVYPAEFVIGNFDTEVSRLSLLGPPVPYEDTYLFASFTLETKNPIRDDVSLKIAADAFLGQFDNPDEIDAVVAPLGREPSYMFDNVPNGNFISRQLLTIHDSIFYHLNFGPTDKELEELDMGSLALWQSVITSFNYLPQGFMDQFTACPTAEENKAPYFNLEGNYCLLFPAYFNIEQSPIQNIKGEESMATTFHGIIPLTGGLDARADLQIAPLGKVDSSLAEAMEPYLVEYSNLDLEREESIIGGEAAMVVAGIPNSDKVAFVIYDNQLYRFTLTPDLETATNAETSEDLTAIWQTVMDSLVFVPDPQ